MSDEQFNIYLAGFVDGEGCMSAGKSERGNGTTYYCRLVISNTNKDILDYIRTKLGAGSISLYAEKKGWKPSYSYAVSQNEASEALRRIYPYLKIKWRQAEILLEIMDSMCYGSKGVPSDVISCRDILISELHELNKRGL